MDNPYVVFPNIANRNRAGDSPSHFVSRFFTVKGVRQERVPTKTRITHKSVGCERQLDRRRGEWNEDPKLKTVDDVRNAAALTHPRI